MWGCVCLYPQTPPHLTKNWQVLNIYIKLKIQRRYFSHSSIKIYAEISTQVLKILRIRQHIGNCGWEFFCCLKFVNFFSLKKLPPNTCCYIKCNFFCKLWNHYLGMSSVEKGLGLLLSKKGLNPKTFKNEKLWLPLKCKKSIESLLIDCFMSLSGKSIFLLLL